MGLSDGTKLISLDFSSLDDCSSLSPAYGFMKTPAILCVEKEEGEEEEQQQQQQQDIYIREVCLLLVVLLLLLLLLLSPHTRGLSIYIY